MRGSAPRACLPSGAAVGRDASGMGPRGVLTDDQWAVIEGLLPPVKGEMGRPATPHRPVVEGIIYRDRAGIPWRGRARDFPAWEAGGGGRPEGAGGGDGE